MSSVLTPNEQATVLSDQVGTEAFTWPAHLNLVFEGEKSRTRLKDSTHIGPLYIQKLFYPEGQSCAHAYLLHPPGGMVSGDDLKIEISSLDQARVLITTPGATKIYGARSNGTEQRQSVALTVEAGASIEWFPLETIVFDDAKARLKNVINLTDDAAFIGWDIVCYGRPAGDALFKKGSIEQTVEIHRNGQLAFIDKLLVNDKNGVTHAMSGLNGRTVYGTLIGFVPVEKTGKQLVSALREKIEDLINEKTNADKDVLSITYVNGFCIARYLGDSSEQAKHLFTLLWQVMRPVLVGREACKPRIWYT